MTKSFPVAWRLFTAPLRLASQIIAKPQAKLFNYSLRTGKLSASWIFIRITCAPRKSQATSILTYYPITCTSVPLKLMETIPLNKLKAYINCPNEPHQFAYKKRQECSRRSSVTSTFNNVKTTQILSCNFLVSFLDYSNAFNTIQV